MQAHPRHIAVIGGGPAGLMAAEVVATAGHRVTVYDRMPSLGRKFLMAGRGGLNLTHSEPLEQFVARYAAASYWLAPCIHAFPPDALRAWCEGLGQETFVGSSGRVFPRSMKAAPLLRAWLMRLEQLGVRYAARHCWQGWDGPALRFTDADGQSVLVTPDATLLALGGASWPRLGSDGGWAALLASCGVPIAPLRAANCGFTVPWSAHFSTRFAGAPLKPVALAYDGIAHQGELMITAQGLEGSPLYALSARLRDAISAHGPATLHLDLRPGMPPEALAQKLNIPRGAISLSTSLRKAGFSPLAINLLREFTPPEHLAHATPAVLAARFKALAVTLTAPSGIARAISTAGGIERAALTSDFMLHAKPGVFAAGEMLDWEAPTGGYLLQGCFSTAVAAARGVLGFLGTGKMG
jgi:uncharacterized flavoprotein (TIGR03862 family)